MLEHPSAELLAGEESEVLLPWQRRLDAGDCFCVVCGPFGVVIYGMVLPVSAAPTGDISPGERWTRTWSAEVPGGLDEWLRIEQADLPLSRGQLDLARRLGWPGPEVALRVVMRMGKVARA